MTVGQYSNSGLPNKGHFTQLIYRKKSQVMGVIATERQTVEGREYVQTKTCLNTAAFTAQLVIEFGKVSPYRSVCIRLLNTGEWAPPQPHPHPQLSQTKP